MDSELLQKIEKATLRIVQAHEIAQQSGNALVLAYSGGKDSDVLLEVAKRSLVPVSVQHNHTTVDAPETVRQIRNVFDELDVHGIPAKINYPDKIEINGKQRRATMWDLIVKMQMPPTRIKRFCCKHLKERSFNNQHLLIGVRWAESLKRKQRGALEYENRIAAKRVIYFDENDPRHKTLEICQLKARVISNPIIDWSDSDIWLYIKYYKLKINPLYGLGFKRIGCIGCPAAGYKEMERQFRLYPKYKAAYLRAFERVVENRKKEGRPYEGAWSDAESMMRWWTGEVCKDSRQKNLF
jgi:phosphoadenosine phosphosulfate reductase